MIRGYCIGGGLGARALLRPAHRGRGFAASRVPAAKLGLGYGYRGLKRLIDVVGPGLRQGDLLHGAPVRRRRGAARWAWSTASCRTPSSRATSTNYADTIAANAPLTVARRQAHRRRGSEGRRASATSRAAGGWSPRASPATTTSKAAPPSWRSASRCSGGCRNGPPAPPLTSPVYGRGRQPSEARRAG